MLSLATCASGFHLATGKLSMTVMEVWDLVLLAGHPVCEVLIPIETRDVLYPLTKLHLSLHRLLTVFSKFQRLVWSCLENVWAFVSSVSSSSGVTGKTNEQDSWQEAQSIPWAWSYVSGLPLNKLSISCQVQTLKPPLPIYFSSLSPWPPE